jgi:hypothetical protein
MRMIDKQLIVMAGGVPAFLTVLVVWRFAPRLFAFAQLPLDNTADRLAFAVRWLLIPGVTLLAGVWVAGRRGFMPEAIEGTRTPSSRSLEINLRYNQNTLEQTVLAVIAWAGLALALHRDQLLLIPAMACLFGFGRLTFWIGYWLHPLGRAFGMVLTVLPTIFAYVWLLSRAFDP